MDRRPRASGCAWLREGSEPSASALEVLWSRLFAQVLHNSVYSFAAVALVILLALALGAAVASVALTRARAESVAAAALVTAAAADGGWFLALCLLDETTSATSA
jgi:hypothetical protein